MFQNEVDLTTVDASGHLRLTKVAYEVFRKSVIFFLQSANLRLRESVTLSLSLSLSLLSCFSAVSPDILRHSVGLCFLWCELLPALDFRTCSLNL